MRLGVGGRAEETALPHPQICDLYITSQDQIARVISSMQPTWIGGINMHAQAATDKPTNPRVRGADASFRARVVREGRAGWSSGMFRPLASPPHCPRKGAWPLKPLRPWP